MTHDEVRDLLAGHALDALGYEDERAVESHLATCAECRRELATLREVAAGLAADAPAADPPAALKARIMRATELEARVEPPAEDVPTVPQRPRPWLLAVAGLAAAIALIMGGLNYSLNRRVAALTSQINSFSERLNQQEQVLVLLASPSARTAALRGTAVQASVRFVYDPLRGQGALIVTGLRDPGADFVYQVWLITGQTPESAGVFRPVVGRSIVVPVKADFVRYQAIAISLELGPTGAPAPSGAPILLATL